jgi:hypothetical protein
LIKKPGVIEAALNHSWFTLKWSVTHEFGQIKRGRLASHEANTLGSRDPGAREIRGGKSDTLKSMITPKSLTAPK